MSSSLAAHDVDPLLIFFLDAVGHPVLDTTLCVIFYLCIAQDDSRCDKVNATLEQFFVLARGADVDGEVAQN
jgi:hypothetical protein